jgi:hypothetical protein
MLERAEERGYLVYMKIYYLSEELAKESRDNFKEYLSSTEVEQS